MASETTQTNSLGGYLTQQQVAQMLLLPLQAASVFLAAGPRIFDTNGGNALRIPRLAASSGAGWVAEGALIGADDATFGELNLLPKNMQSLKVITKVSDELIRQAVVDVSAALQARLVNDVAAALDTALIASAVTDGTVPTGLLSQANVQTTAITGAITLDALQDAISKLIAANVDLSLARWMLTPYCWGVLRKLKEGTTNRYMLEPDPTQIGVWRLLGLPVTVTPRIPTDAGAGHATTVVLWCPSMYAVARDISPEVTILREAYADHGQVGIRVTCRYDAAVMYPESIVTLTAVTGG